MKLKNIIESISKETNSPKETDSKLIGFILESLNLRTQTHIYHLLTKSYSEHVAIGAFYDALIGSVDSIAEMSIGLDINTDNGNSNHSLTFSYKKSKLIEEIKDYRETINSLLEATDTASLAGINDAIMGIQAQVDTLLYKLQLS